MNSNFGENLLSNYTIESRIGTYSMIQAKEHMDKSTKLMIKEEEIQLQSKKFSWKSRTKVCPAPP